MKFVPVWSYDNYVPAHIAMGMLKEENIDCWLKDENTVTIDPILSNAVGGIKLMVAEPDALKAFDLLTKIQDQNKAALLCPHCGSGNIELVSTPRKPLTWLTAIATFFLGDYALATKKVYHCFDCNHEFNEAVHRNTDPSKN